MRSRKRNNLEDRRYKRVRFRSCGTVGYGPTLISRVVKNNAIKLQGKTENNLLAMSTTTSVPRERDEENHFPAR